MTYFAENMGQSYGDTFGGRSRNELCVLLVFEGTTVDGKKFASDLWNT